MQGGYSTSENTTDAFIKTSHLMAKIRRTLKEKLSVHKEITRGARNQHDKAIKDLTNQLNEYFDPFLDGPARHFKSGVEIEQVVMKGLLSSDEIGEKCFKDFVERRIKAKEE